jgi:hypothetical protein
MRMIKLLAWLMRPIVEEATRQTHVRRYKECAANHTDALASWHYMTFGSGVSDEERDRLEQQAEHFEAGAQA